MKFASLIKIVIAVGVFFYLWWMGAIDLQALKFGLPKRLDTALVIFTCLIAGILIGGVRWWLILRAADVHLPLSRVISLQFIGAFFSTWLPGAAGGDAARGLYLARDLNARRTTALLTILIDRCFALFGLLAVACLLIASWLAQDEVPLTLYLYAQITLMLLATGSALALAAIAAAYFVKLPQFPRWLERARPFGHQVRLAIQLVSKRWAIMIVCAVLSCVACVLVAIGIIIISLPYGFAPSPQIVAIAGIIGNLSSAIPITPGGLGIGEAAFAHVAIELSGSVAPYATIYLTFRVAMALTSFSGALCWLFRSDVVAPSKST